MTKEREAKQITPSVPFFAGISLEKNSVECTLFKRQESGRCRVATPSSKLRSDHLLCFCSHITKINRTLQALHSR